MGRLSLGAVLGLRDKNFTTGLKKASNKADTFGRKMKHAGNSAKNFQAAVSGGMMGAAKSLAGLAAGAFAVKSVVAEVTLWTKAANERIAAETKLETLMGNTAGVTKAQISGLKTYAGELQNLGVVEADVAVAGMAQLGAFKLQAGSVKALSAGMLDLAVKQHGVNVSGEQLSGIANVVGKAMQGNAGVLRRHGIVLSAAEEKQIKYGTEAQRAAVLSRALEMQVGGMNAAMARTPEGAVMQFRNALGDVREELGMRLLPIISKGIGWVSERLPAMTSFVLGGVDGIASGVSRLSGTFAWLKGLGVSLWNGLRAQIDANREPLQQIGSAVRLLGQGFSWVYKSIAQPFLEWLGGTGLPVAFGVMIRLAGLAAGAVHGIRNAFVAVSSAVASVRAGVGAAFAWLGGAARGFANSFIGANNAVVRGLNAIQIQVPNWVPVFGGKAWGFNLKETPMLAQGTPWWGGGQAIVGERGPELVNLPRGAEVVPNSRLGGAAGGPVTFNVNINAANMSAAEIVAKVVPLLRLAVSNAAG